MTIEEMEKDLSIDKYNLDMEVVNLGKVVNKYSEEYSKALNIRVSLEREQQVAIIEAKDNLNEITDKLRKEVAKRKLYYRRGGECGLKKVPSESALNELIDVDEALNELVLEQTKAKKELELAKTKTKELIEAEYNESIADGLKRAIFTKPLALNNLNNLYKTNYYADSETI